MRKLIFLAFFLLFALASANAEEKKYLTIGADPVETDICKKKNLQSFKIDRDAYVATTAKSRKVSVGWIPAGTEVGILSADENVLCACGNSVKILRYKEAEVEKPAETEKTAVAPVQSQPQPQVTNNYYITVPQQTQAMVPYYYRGGYGYNYFPRSYVVHDNHYSYGYHRHRDRHHDHRDRNYRSRPRHERPRNIPTPTPSQGAHPAAPPIP